MIDKHTLPEGWEVKKLGEVAEVGPKIPNREGISDELEIQFLPMRLVEEENGKIHLTETRKYGEVKKGYTPFIDGDVIFAKVTPCMENGKIAVVNNLKNGIGFGSSEFHVIRSKGIVLDEFLFHFLVQQRFRKEAQNEMTGAVGLRRVPKKFLEDYLIPIPPLSEQQEIVAKIEELLSELDQGKLQLETARQQLKVYRQAVLKWAFEGKLTNAIQNRQKTQEGELPEGWKLTKLDKVGKLFCGQSPSVSEVNREGKGILYVTGPEQWDGVKIKETKWTEFPKRLVPDGTIFITVKGAGVGKLFPGTACAIGRDVYAYLPSEVLNHKFAYHALKHSIDLVVMQAQGDIPGLAKNHILDHAIGICSMEEQHRVVQEIESRLSVCDKVEKTITQSLQQAETLRQSILKQAFEGKLVKAGKTISELA